MCLLLKQYGTLLAPLCRGAVCKSDVNDDVEAMVVCRALGWSGSATLRDAPSCSGFIFSSCEELPANLTVSWSSFACTGAEDSPAECAHQDANWQVWPRKGEEPEAWRGGGCEARLLNGGRSTDPHARLLLARHGRPWQAWSPSGDIKTVCESKTAVRVSCSDDAGKHACTQSRMGSRLWRLRCKGC